jgi:hypothetical protein
MAEAFHTSSAATNPSGFTDQSRAELSSHAALGDSPDLSRQVVNHVPVGLIVWHLKHLNDPNSFQLVAAHLAIGELYWTLWRMKRERRSLSYLPSKAFEGNTTFSFTAAMGMLYGRSSQLLPCLTKMANFPFSRATSFSNTNSARLPALMTTCCYALGTCNDPIEPM